MLKWKCWEMLEAKWEGKKTHQVLKPFLFINWHLSREDTEITHHCLSLLSTVVKNTMAISN